MGAYAGALCLLEILKTASRQVTKSKAQIQKQENQKVLNARYNDSDYELSDVEDDPW